MRTVLAGIVVAALAGSAAASPADFETDLDGQLGRLAAELPCPEDDDSWRITRTPPLRVVCPWTAQTRDRNRALWIAAFDRANALSLDALRADAARYAGSAYVFTGRVRAAETDAWGRAHVLLVAADGRELEVVGVGYAFLQRRGQLVDAVGYLAGWSQDARIPSLAAASLVAAGEVARTVARWSPARAVRLSGAALRNPS